MHLNPSRLGTTGEQFLGGDPLSLRHSPLADDLNPSCLHYEHKATWQRRAAAAYIVPSNLTAEVLSTSSADHLTT